MADPYLTPPVRRRGRGRIAKGLMTVGLIGALGGAYWAGEKGFLDPLKKYIPKYAKEENHKRLKLPYDKWLVIEQADYDDVIDSHANVNAPDDITLLAHFGEGKSKKKYEIKISDQDKSEIVDIINALRMTEQKHVRIKRGAEMNLRPSSAYGGALRNPVTSGGMQNGRLVIRADADFIEFAKSGYFTTESTKQENIGTIETDGKITWSDGNSFDGLRFGLEPDKYPNELQTIRELERSMDDVEADYDTVREDVDSLRTDVEQGERKDQYQDKKINELSKNMDNLENRVESHKRHRDRNAPKKIKHYTVKRIE